MGFCKCSAVEEDRSSWMDVLIKAEEVVAIVFALQHNKAVVVFAVRGCIRIGSVVTRRRSGGKAAPRNDHQRVCEPLVGPSAESVARGALRNRAVKLLV